MKASCTQENFSNGLQIVGRSIGTRTTLPVLNNILIKTEKGGLRLSATDLEVGVSTWIGAKVDSEGAVTVPAKLLVDYINSNSDNKIDMSLKEVSLNLWSEHYKANIKGIDAAEFPLIPEVKKLAEIIVSAQDFKNAIAKTIIAVALDESRPVLAGIYCKASSNTLVMAATDSYRLAEQKINLEKKIDKEITFIVPARTFAEVLRILGDSGQVLINPGENQVEIIYGVTTIVSRLINGAYPDYEQIIPSKTTTAISLSRNEFSSALKMAQIFSRDQANNIKLSFEAPNKIAISAASATLGDNVAQVSGEVSGETTEVSFNAKFILDALGALKSEKIKFDLSGDLKPAQIMGEQDANYLHVIMPLRTEE